MTHRNGIRYVVRKGPGGLVMEPLQDARDRLPFLLNSFALQVAIYSAATTEQLIRSRDYATEGCDLTERSDPNGLDTSAHTQARLGNLRRRD
jgi:hypothetical protein